MNLKISKRKILKIVYSIIRAMLFSAAVFYGLTTCIKGILLLFTLIIRTFLNLCENIISQDYISPQKIFENPTPLMRSFMEHIRIFVVVVFFYQLPKVYKETKNYIEYNSRIEIFTDFLKILDIIQFLLSVLVAGFVTVFTLGVLIIELISYSFYGQFTSINPQSNDLFIFFLCFFLPILIIELIIRGSMHFNKNIKIKRELEKRIEQD